jgi:charged multivesicular body protein 5
LDALQLEDEEEGTSYLADINKVPDFVDEPPVEMADVSLDVNLLPLEIDE